jgi:hypothetical protein
MPTETLPAHLCIYTCTYTQSVTATQLQPGIGLLSMCTCSKDLLYACDTGICSPSPSNQSFYRQIAGYQRGAGDHKVGQ